MLCQKCLGNFRTEVAKVYAEGITACFFDVFQSLYHVDLALHDTDRAFIDIFCVIFCFVSIHQRLSSVYGKALREAVTADSYDTQFDFWNVVHDSVPPYILCLLFICLFLAGRREGD